MLVGDFWRAIANKGCPYAFWARNELFQVKEQATTV
jgi:hypothetical protein